MPISAPYESLGSECQEKKKIRDTDIEKISVQKEAIWRLQSTGGITESLLHIVTRIQSKLQAKTIFPPLSHSYERPALNNVFHINVLILGQMSEQGRQGKNNAEKKQARKLTISSSEKSNSEFVPFSRPGSNNV